MRKVILGLLAIVLVALMTLVVVSCVPSCKNDNANNAIVSELTLIEDTYAIGDIAMFRVRATSDIEMTRVTYKLNNGNEIEVSVKKGLAKNMSGKFGDGTYYIDTGVEMLDTAKMPAGNYVIAWYIYDDNNTRYDFTNRYVFEIVSVQAAA